MASCLNSLGIFCPIHHNSFGSIQVFLFPISSWFSWLIIFVCRDANNYSVCEDFLWLCLIAIWQHDEEGSKDEEKDEHSASFTQMPSSSANQFNRSSSNNLERSKDHSTNSSAVQGMRKAVCQMIYCELFLIYFSLFWWITIFYSMDRFNPKHAVRPDASQHPLCHQQWHMFVINLFQVALNFNPTY